MFPAVTSNKHVSDQVLQGVKYRDNKGGEITTWVLSDTISTHEILYCDKQRRDKMKTPVIF